MEKWSENPDLYPLPEQLVLRVENFMAQGGQKVCYIHRQGHMVLCVRTQLGERSSECKYCPTREILEESMWKYKWTQWAGDNEIIPDADHLFDNYPDLEKCKQEIVEWAHAKNWEDLMKRPNTSMYSQMVFAKYVTKSKEWLTNNKPFIQDIIKRLKDKVGEV